MTAITAAVNRQAKGVPKTRRVLMANSITIVKGELVGILDADGLAVKGVTGATVVWIIGVAAETKTSGTGGADWIQVEYDREYLFAATSITQAMLGDAMLIVDNNTIDETSAGSATVGKLTEYVSATLGWVHIPGVTT
ncbi:hypothetical protein LCGC14_2188120 [marine sediment metagenome]|uniref:Uncharacterized protein n=1 Tax=marine sediment metagenome TaxID=412755 RepID=A0A0F9E7E6_9ZZZZ